MRIKLIIFLTILVIGVAYGVWDRYAPPMDAYKITINKDDNTMSIGDIIPDVVLTDLNGTSHTLHDLKDKNILINFWATWCPPCVAEFPDLLSLAEQYPDTLTLVTISIDKYPKNITTFFEKYSEDIQELLELDNVILGHDQSQRITRDTFKVYRYPESILIGPDLKIIKKVEGIIDISDKSIHKAIKSLKN